MTRPIESIVNHYTSQLQQVIEPYERNIAELQAKQAELVTRFPDPIESILQSKFSAIEVATWPEQEARQAYAHQLLSDCIERVSERCERARLPIENRISHTVGAYQATLGLKQNIIKLSLSGEIPPVFLQNYHAQADALFNLCSDAPAEYLDELKTELNTMPTPSSFDKLVA